MPLFLGGFGFSLPLDFFFGFFCDEIDGPHARRNNGASYLGEFIDHGFCDSLQSILIMPCCIPIFKGKGLYLNVGVYAYILSAMFAAFLTHFEVVVTNEMYLGYIDFAEGQMFLMFFMLHFRSCRCREQSGY